jgi:hypothetical protein
MIAESVEQQTLTHLARIFTSGSPTICQATATNTNLQSYIEYKNHPTIGKNWEKMYKTVSKDIHNGYVLHFNKDIHRFIYHLHVTPQGIVNIDNPNKKDRPFFDSSFRPKPWSIAINDMTNKINEPPLYFPKTLKEFFTWIWNLRISYPHEEIYIGDDNATGAFRHVKYNPNLVAMHASLVRDWLFMSTGQTFGDTTCPQNWEPVAYARRQHAQLFLWSQDDTVQRAKEYLPEIITTPDPSPTERRHIAQATSDELNKGVFDIHGNRLPPKFDHHVDTCIYANTKQYVSPMISSSTIAIYNILGYSDQESRTLQGVVRN